METQLCSICFNETAEDPCAICRDPSRDGSVLAVVQQPSDVLVWEKSSFNGRYHVLHGFISPRAGIGPNQLKIRELVERVRQGGIQELILWRSTTMESEATVVFLVDQLRTAGLLRLKLTTGQERRGRNFGASSDLIWRH